MARAEYESQKALSAIIPDNVVAPTAWGYFECDKTKSFYLTRFRNLRPQVPPTPEFLDTIKRLHQASISPTGKFGFHCKTYWGPPVMRNEWTDSWEKFWGRQFRSDVAYAQQVYGKDEDLDTLTEEFIEKVVARLLRPLQTGGRSIKPSLCHGDLWDGNVQMDTDTGQTILFDSCAFYGHAEGRSPSMFERDFLLADPNTTLQSTFRPLGNLDMLCRWMWSTYTRLRLEPLSRKKTFTTDIIYMECESDPCYLSGNDAH